MGVIAMVHSFEHFQISQSKMGFIHLGSYLEYWLHFKSIKAQHCYGTKKLL
jgi:hypothetical protein